VTEVSNKNSMRTDLFDFDLPADRIALRPASPRDSARLLVVRPGAAVELEDRIIRDLPELLQPGDQLVVNDTKVISAQLSGRRLGGAAEPKIEATLIKRLDGSRWQALVKPARKLRLGDVVRFGEEGRVCFLGQLDATVEAKGEAGDYQTMFARQEGAVAAPTAGLHFTESLIARLAARGIAVHTVTLHVGAGTFLPVKADDVSGHKMHAEWGEVTEEVAAALGPRAPERLSKGRPPLLKKEAGETPALPRRIVAVGTTSLRLLESAARPDGTIAPFAGDTSLFITPGYRFRAVDVLLTNFHLPRSTLFMLVAAFCSLDTMKRAYAHAVQTGYRFYSYGDACLLFRNHG
jgi:S-adenosylmethionine:tRNA ribosyltransferase-isomerase